MKTNIAIDISTPIRYLAKLWVSSYGPKCCQPIKFQGFNISRKEYMTDFIFGIQINIEIFYKLMMSFLLCKSRHAESTQNNFAYFCSVSRKA